MASEYEWGLGRFMPIVIIEAPCMTLALGTVTELVTHLSVGASTSESPEYDCLFAGQRWVQLES